MSAPNSDSMAWLLRVRGLRAIGRHHEALFFLWAFSWTLAVGASFLAAMFRATGGQWSAPLDDTFIHFDFARSIARGHPFEWSPGSGFSSGSTSIVYPFVLAVGYLVGFRDTSLMAWATGVAFISCLGFFWGVARLFRPFGPAAKFLLPPATLSVGFIDWTLWSGMETAFVLGVFGLVVRSWDRVVGLPDRPAIAIHWAGLIGWTLLASLLVSSRPEAVVLVVWFPILWGERLALTRRLAVLVGPIVALGGWALVCWVLTGEPAQAGSVAKLVWYDPYLSTAEKLRSAASNLHFAVVRTTWHHLSTRPPFGLLVPLVAALPLVDRRVRRISVGLWLQLVSWCLLVAQNPHVRFQNERYLVLPAAFLMVLAAIGLVSLGSTFGAAARPALRRAAVLVALVAPLLHGIVQTDRYRSQRWLFARASKNILEQQVEVGRRLLNVAPRRVFVGDAGAITYVSDRPGLDGVGLGGYRRYPFARAYRHGVGATLELLERMPPAERPDLFAVYPSWWGGFPEVFGSPLFDVTIEGNVICADATKRVFRSDYWAFDRGSAPRDGGRILDALDLADVLSEEAHHYAPIGREGRVFWTTAKVNPRGPDAFDAGRIYDEGGGVSFRAEGIGGAAALIVRTDGPAELAVIRDGMPVGIIVLSQSSTWSEASLDLGDTTFPSAIELKALTSTRLSHVWLVARER
jgi:hypothetical protein